MIDSPRVKQLRTMLEDNTLAELLDRYLNFDESKVSPNTASHYQDLRRRLGASRFVFPITGVQGCGKSTLLNALLFEEPVLPIDADETTCVPTEIQYDANPGGMAEVHFKDGPHKEVAAEEESLAEFLHNERNPGNKLGVDRVVVYSSSPVLASGMVLVDLPGLGSLTKANRRTTLTYLNESVGILYLLRTVPPLTDSEAFVLGTAWKRIPLAMFLQNRWNDERDCEVREGLDHNILRLKKIAEKNRIPLTDEPEILVLNVYNAWQKVLHGERGNLAGSGYDMAVAALEKLGSAWAIKLEEQVRQTMLGDILKARGYADARLADFNAGEGLAERMAAEKRRFNQYDADLEDRCQQTLASLQRFEKEMTEELERWDRDTRSSLRNLMRTKMRAGIVDGPRLERALRDEQEGPLEGVYVDFKERCLTLADKIAAQYENITAWQPLKGDTIRTVQIEEGTKIEELMPAVAGAAGGVGGAIGGAEVGASMGSFFGPVGTVIGSVVGGLLGGLLGGYVGSKGREYAAERRVEKAWPIVRSAIDAFVKETVRDIRWQMKAFSEQLTRELTGWREAQRRRYRREYEAKLAFINADNHKKQVQMNSLEEDISRLNGYREQLEGPA